ncbi:MAG TPA: GH3 auxin-responsive promoter family protein, partial [Saprospiraceae bacterium]|nr:GH3 auxin-responsive promoter family protein [Saprospiraceae bacterium]
MAEWINSAFRVYLRQRYRQIERFMQQPHETQRLLWRQLMQYAQHTEWGKRYDYGSLRSPEDYARRVPVQDYESAKPHIQRMMHGERDVLWPGRVKWFSKSSGTTSDKSKFIPVPGVKLRQCNLMGSRDAMALFYHRRPD